MTPALRFTRSPCPDCGALTELEAETKCKPHSDQTGEVFCDGEFDSEGYSVRPTAESLAELDAWCDTEICKVEDQP